MADTIIQNMKQIINMAEKNIFIRDDFDIMFNNFCIFCSTARVENDAQYGDFAKFLPDILKYDLYIPTTDQFCKIMSSRYYMLFSSALVKINYNYTFDEITSNHTLQPYIDYLVKQSCYADIRNMDTQIFCTSPKKYNLIPYLTQSAYDQMLDTLKKIRLTITDSTFEKLCIFKEFDFITEKYISDLDFSPKIVNSILKSESVSLMKYIITKGYNFTANDLEFACTKKIKKSVITILENKVVPTKACFDALFVNNNTFSMNDFVNIFTEFGYVPTQDDAILAAKNRTVIPNFSLYDIKLTSELFEVSYEAGYLGYNFEGINPTLKCIQYECKKNNNLSSIKKLTKIVKPDIICLQNACGVKNNINVVKYLIELGVKPDDECVRNMTNTLGNKSMEYLITTYLGNNKLKQKQN